jgi:hypothetical protein
LWLTDTHTYKMMMAEKVAENSYVVKLSFNGEVRRFALDTTSFAQLHSTIIGLVASPVNLVLKYQDDEGDKITMSSDSELGEALKISKGTLRLFGEVSSVVATAPPAVPAFPQCGVRRGFPQHPFPHHPYPHHPHPHSHHYGGHGMPFGHHGGWKVDKAAWKAEMKDSREEWKAAKAEMKTQRALWKAHCGKAWKHQHPCAKRSEVSLEKMKEYEALADAVQAKGFLKRRKIVHLLIKYDGNVETVVETLTRKAMLKQQRKESQPQGMAI